MSIHNKEKKLNPGICSQVSYLPIHGTNNRTIDRKHLKGNEDMSRTASTDLPPETNLFSFWDKASDLVGRKKALGVMCPDFNTFDTVLQDIVISHLEKPGWEENIILGQCTAGWPAVVRKQLPVINCETGRRSWAGALRSVVDQSVMWCFHWWVGCWKAGDSCLFCKLRWAADKVEKGFRTQNNLGRSDEWPGQPRLWAAGNLCAELGMYRLRRGYKWNVSQQGHTLVINWNHPWVKTEQIGLA